MAATGPAHTIVNKLADERWQCYAGVAFLYGRNGFE
jgi:hypothetical protein